MKTAGIAILLLTTIFATGCSHNFGACVIGKGFMVGETGLQYFNGLAILDTSRENSGWKIEIDDEDGLTQTDGNIKGIRSVERTVGRQVTGYLVDLAESSPDAVKGYLHDGQDKGE